MEKCTFQENLLIRFLVQPKESLIMNSYNFSFIMAGLRQLLNLLLEI